MNTMIPCTSAESAAIASLWNVKVLDAASCWFGAPTTDAAAVTQLMADGFIFALAESPVQPVGFGFWRGPWLNAFAADGPEAYYRLMLAYVDDNLAAGRTALVATIGASVTTEYGWLTALSAVTLTPVGFEPIAIGQSPSSRVPTVLEVSADAATLRANLVALLGGAP